MSCAIAHTILQHLRETGTPPAGAASASLPAVLSARPTEARADTRSHVQEPPTTEQGAVAEAQIDTTARRSAPMLAGSSANAVAASNNNQHVPSRSERDAARLARSYTLLGESTPGQIEHLPDHHGMFRCRNNRGHGLCSTGGDVCQGT